MYTLESSCARINKNIMKYVDFERHISQPRCAKYLKGCNHKTRKAIALYKANLRLSQKLFSVLSVFEVVLRNKIDTHYRNVFKSINGSYDWILFAAGNGGYLTVKGCEKSMKTVKDAIQSLRSGYAHDKLVAELSFGFWRFQFAAKEFRAAGSTLHLIFPNRPGGTNNTDIFKMLGFINKIRNRIAHHEPICFNTTGDISATYARHHYNTILEILTWLDIDANRLLFGIDKVEEELRFIDSLKV